MTHRDMIIEDVEYALLAEILSKKTNVDILKEKKAY